MAIEKPGVVRGDGFGCNCQCQVSGCAHPVVGSIVNGSFIRSGENHGTSTAHGELGHNSYVIESLVGEHVNKEVVCWFLGCSVLLQDVDPQPCSVRICVKIVSIPHLFMTNLQIS